MKKPPSQLPSPTADAPASGPESVRRQAHPNCIVCSPHHRCGCRLQFVSSDDGSVQATFACSKAFEGYSGFVHGGVISALLDGAMTNWLFAHGHQAVTGELNVSFLHPVVTDRAAIVRAWIDWAVPPFHVLQAELIQEDRVKAKGTGKFLERPQSEAK